MSFDNFQNLQASKMSKELQQSILQLYEPKKLLGSGAYGHVWKVMDRESRRELALKKIFDAFHNDVDAQRTYREITVLHELEHYNIIKLHRVLKAKNNRDLYLVFDYVQADLQSLVGQQILEDVHIRFVTYQILRGLKYLHSAQLIHRDLKPSNILINSECQIKICDFGLVRSLTHQQDQPMILSEEVATRWYRSPQMLLGSKTYGKETDVWSVGCILAELVMGQPIFPGDSTLNQLQKILEFTGIPSKHNIDSIQSDTAESLINQLTTNRKSFQEYFKKTNKQIIGLICRMLEFNPKKRITIEEALELDMFAEFRTHKSYEDICTKFIVPQLDDNQRLTLQSYRKMIYTDIERRYPEINPQLNDSFQKSPHKQNKQNKRIVRSHHSLNRKKSFDHYRALNSSVTTNHQSQNCKKQASSSFHHGDSVEKIKRMKREWKKQSGPSSFYNQNAYESYGTGNNGGNIRFKPDSYYKNSPKGLVRKQSNALLTKVRSRKLLCRSKSKQKLLGILDKKRLIR